MTTARFCAGVALVASAVLHLSIFAVAAAASDFHYLYWTIIATAMAAFLAVAPSAKFDHAEDRRL